MKDLKLVIAEVHAGTGQLSELNGENSKVELDAVEVHAGVDTSVDTAVVRSDAESIAHAVYFDYDELDAAEAGFSIPPMSLIAPPFWAMTQVMGNIWISGYSVIL